MKKYVVLAVAALFLASPAFAADPAAAPEAARVVAVPDTFDKMDADHDGKVTKEEWLAYQSKVFGEICPDGDNAITRDEWKEFQSKGAAQ